MNKFALLALAAVAVVATVVFGLSSAEATYWGTWPPFGLGSGGGF